MQRKLLFVGVILLALAGGLAALQHAGQISLPSWVLTLSRWLAVAALAAYAVKRRSLTVWILVAMVAGTALGVDWPAVAVESRVLSQIFLRLIKTIIAPLLFSTLVVGIAGHHDIKQVGRMGVKSLVYFEVVTTFALLIGLAAINVSRAGVGVTLPAASTGEVLDAPHRTAGEVVLHSFPENIAKSIAEGEVLQIVVFCVIFGVALAFLPQDRRRPLLALCEGLAETMFKFTNLVMLLAPLGVGAAIAYTVGHVGLGVLVNLAELLLTLYCALGLFLVLVLAPIGRLAGVPMRDFIRAVAEPAAVAFATTSSEAALPRAMESMEALGVPRQIVAFVMPTGYSFNLDGSALYLSLASVFVAQVAGVQMTPGQQLMMVFTLMLTSKGVAGMPRASLVILLGTASSFHLPVEPIFLILGIDELMDMARTAVNVIGNCLATVVVARWEGQFRNQQSSTIVGEALQASPKLRLDSGDEVEEEVSGQLS